MQHSCVQTALIDICITTNAIRNVNFCTSPKQLLSGIYSLPSILRLRVTKIEVVIAELHVISTRPSHTLCYSMAIEIYVTFAQHLDKHQHDLTSITNRTNTAPMPMNLLLPGYPFPFALIRRRIYIANLIGIEWANITVSSTISKMKIAIGKYSTRLSIHHAAKHLYTNVANVYSPNSIQIIISRY